MLDNKKISVLITSHKLRFNTLDLVIKSWLTQPIDELWIVDDGTGFKTTIKDDRLLIFNMPKDFETKADYCLALMTEGDLIIMADDDDTVKGDFVKDLYDWHVKLDAVVGIAGKQFFGPGYIRDTKVYKSHRIKEPKKVGFVGIIFMSPRKYFGFDVKGMHKNCDDFWFCMKEHPYINKYVVPTKNYNELPTSEYRDVAMHRTSSLHSPRRKFYTEYYNRYFKDFKDLDTININELNKEKEKEKELIKIAKQQSREVKNNWKDLINTIKDK